MAQGSSRGRQEVDAVALYLFHDESLPSAKLVGVVAADQEGSDDGIEVGQDLTGQFVRFMTSRRTFLATWLV